jgi:hypothetical protein
MRQSQPKNTNFERKEAEHFFVSTLNNDSRKVSEKEIKRLSSSLGSERKKRGTSKP